jgi:hypothetical protein
MSDIISDIPKQRDYVLILIIPSTIFGKAFTTLSIALIAFVFQSTLFALFIGSCVSAELIKVTLFTLLLGCVVMIVRILIIIEIVSELVVFHLF